jgi:hypothetical protein
MKFFIKQGGLLVIILGLGVLVWSVEQQVNQNTPYLISALFLIGGLLIHIFLNRIYS